MKEIRKLVRIYDDLLKNKTSKFIRNSFNPKEESLFQLYQTDVSENTISKELYNSTPSHQSFQSLKRSLLDKLYSIVITTNVSKSYDKQRLDAARELLVVKFLSVLSFRSLLIGISEKTIKKCLKLHMYNEAAELARILSEHYSVFSVKKKDAYTFHDLAVKCNKTFGLEIKYDWIYQQYRSLYGTPAFEASASKMEATADELEQLFDLNSSRLAFYYFDLRFFHYYIRADYKSLEEICFKAMAYYDSLSFNHVSARNIFIFHLIEVYLNFNSLRKAEDLIIQFLDQSDTRNVSHYRYKELLLRLYLNQANLDQAQEVFDYLKGSVRRSSNIFNKDRYILYEMYIAILAGNTLNFRRINYNMNKIKKDKKGMHVPFLIAQAIYFYLNDPDKLIDKLDALNQYSYKYLKEEKFERTRQFIKILNRIMSLKDYSDIKISVASEQINNNGIEMVSYENLLKILETRKNMIWEYA